MGPLTWVEVAERVGVPTMLILLLSFGAFFSLRWLARNAIKPLVAALGSYVSSTTKFQSEIAANAHRGTVQNEELLRVQRDHGAALAVHDRETREVMLDMKARLENYCPLFKDPVIAQAARARLTPAPGAHQIASAQASDHDKEKSL